MLIDGNNYMYRANIAFANFGYTASAVETSENVMIFNFFRNLRATIEQFQPEKVYFVLEGHPKHRYEILPEYKANRIVKTAEKKEAKDKFYINAHEIIRLLNYLPVTFAKAENYECDDVISTLVDDLKDEDVLVVSSDSDYIQLLQKNYARVAIWNATKKEFMKPPPYHYIGWKCLAGDKSDNIKNIVGPKKAEKLITSPELLSEFLSVEENRAKFNINKSLIEFSNIPREEIVLSSGERQYSLLKEEFIKLEFQSLVNDKAWEKFTTTFDCIKF